MTTSSKILVTGAGGFVGGRVVERCFLGGRHEVRAGIHSWSSAARLGRFPVEICPCNILDDGQLDRALDGVTVRVRSLSTARKSCWPPPCARAFAASFTSARATFTATLRDWFPKFIRKNRLATSTAR